MNKEPTSWNIWNKLSQKQKDELCESKDKINTVIQSLSIEMVPKNDSIKRLKSVANTLEKIIK